MHKNQGTEQSFGAIQFRNALEQFQYIHTIMQEKMQAAMIWQRQTTEHFQRLAQQYYENHMQKGFQHKKNIPTAFKPDESA